MVKGKILFADNDPVFLETWSAVLRVEHYDVTAVPSVKNAREAFDKGGFDLAILDLRLETENDPADDSGLRLAKEHYGLLPIVILSGELNKEALLWAVQDKRPGYFLSVVDKRQGPEVLLREMRKALPPKVFVSHGHDDNASCAVANFLERGGAQPVVLKEQATASWTILDAFEEHANVQFAIILMTADDEGRLKGQNALQPRARQNVVFELGFFLAKLGRSRVVALSRQGEPVEWPSNYHGVLYQEIDPWGRWQDKLAATMRAVGIELH